MSSLCKNSLIIILLIGVIAVMSRYYFTLRNSEEKRGVLGTVPITTAEPLAPTEKDMFPEITIEEPANAASMEEKKGKSDSLSPTNPLLQNFGAETKKREIFENNEGIKIIPPPAAVPMPETLPNIFDIAKRDSPQLVFWLKKAGAAKIMQKLLEDAGGGSTIDCHQESHNVGRVAYALFGAKVFGEGNASCHSGFYHGAMETFLFQEGTGNLAQKIDNLCSFFDTSFGKFECLHGVGHGVLAFHDYDLPMALETCRSLRTDYDASSCYGGVFMENIITAQGLGAVEAHETEWASKDPHFPCNSLGDDFNAMFQCYQMQTSWMLWLNNYDFEKVTSICLSAPASMKSVCFKSYGRDAAGHTLRDKNKIIELCGNVPNESDYYEQCIIGALNVIVDFWGDGLGYQANDLCELVRDKEKRSCYVILASRINGIFNDMSDKARLCGGFEPAYQHLCAAK